MRKSDYVIQPTDKSFCMKCGNPLHLLCDKDLRDKPAFYICFNCKQVTEVGKGVISEPVDEPE